MFTIKINWLGWLVCLICLLFWSLVSWLVGLLVGWSVWWWVGYFDRWVGLQFKKRLVHIFVLFVGVFVIWLIESKWLVASVGFVLVLYLGWLIFWIGWFYRFFGWLVCLMVRWLVDRLDYNFKKDWFCRIFLFNIFLLAGISESNCFMSKRYQI